MSGDEAARARDEAEVVAALRAAPELYERLYDALSGELPHDALMAMMYTRMAFLNHTMSANTTVQTNTTLQ